MAARERDAGGVRRRPPLARWWASAGLAFVVALVVSAAGFAGGLDYPVIALVVAAATTACVGGLHLIVRGRRDPRADLRDLADGRLEPTAPSAVAVLGVGLFVFDQVMAGIIATAQASVDDITPLAVLSSYVLPCAAALALAAWAGRLTDRPLPAVLAGVGIAVLLDTVVLVVGLGIPLSQLGAVVPAVVGYWTTRGAVLLAGGIAGAVITSRSRAAFIARREARLTHVLSRRGDVGGRP